MVGLAVLAALAIIGGFIGGLVSWIGAMANTAELEDKTWFVLLLVLGLFSFGLVAMIAYVIAGPDGWRAMALAPPAHGRNVGRGRDVRANEPWPVSRQGRRGAHWRPLERPSLIGERPSRA